MLAATPFLSTTNKKILQTATSPLSTINPLTRNDVHEGIVEKFRECYSELYNSADTTKEMMNIKEKVNQIIDNNRDLSYVEVRKINPSVVKDAVRKPMWVVVTALMFS